jgi:hypothetical protein
MPGHYDICTDPQLVRSGVVVQKVYAEDAHTNVYYEVRISDDIAIMNATTTSHFTLTAPEIGTIAHDLHHAQSASADFIASLNDVRTRFREKDTEGVSPYQLHASTNSTANL